MKYYVSIYQEGSQPRDNDGYDTLAEARQRAKMALSIHDEELGRRMRRHPHVIDDELEGYEAIESWTAQGGTNGDNETDFVTIFRRMKDKGE